MQQTSKYKLNKPGTDDVISPVPLNENMDKLEGALSALEGQVAAVNGRVTTVDNRVTAVDGRRVFDHLLTATAPEGVKEFTVDLSGIDLTQYGALVVVFAGEEGSQPLKLSVNSSNEVMNLLARGASSGFSDYSGGGMGIMIPTVDRVFCASFSAGLLPGSHSGTGYGMLTTPWNEFAQFKIFPVGTYALVALYGLRL